MSLDRRRFIGAAAALLVGAPALAPSPTLPSKATVLSAIRLVNDHWLATHGNPGNNQWARATYFSGNMAAYRATGETRYLTYARNWGRQNNFAVNGGNATRHADNHCAGQAYFDLYEIDRDPAYLTNIVDSISRMKAGGTTDWWWVDALHMAMPVFVRVSQHLNDAALLSRMWSLYYHPKHTLKLYDYTDELWYRDAKYLWPNGSQSHSPGGQHVYWSRGNGWAFAAHAKVLGLLPPGDMRWPEYTYNPQGLARALLTRQRADGFWNVNLGDAQHYPGPETSGTALSAFGLAYSIRTGLISSATYLPVLAKAWNGMVATAVQPDGFLGYVQNVGENPGSSQPVTAQSTADFGVGAFLLAGSEIAKLAS